MHDPDLGVAVERARAAEAEHLLAALGGPPEARNGAFRPGWRHSLQGRRKGRGRPREQAPAWPRELTNALDLQMTWFSDPRTRLGKGRFRQKSARTPFMALDAESGFRRRIAVARLAFLPRFMPGHRPRLARGFVFLVLRFSESRINRAVAESAYCVILATRIAKRPQWPVPANSRRFRA